MLINNFETAIDKDDLFYCGSLNLKKFFEQNGLVYISSYTKKSTNKNIYIYVKSDKLKELLVAWTENGRKRGGEKNE